MDHLYIPPGVERLDFKTPFYGIFYDLEVCMHSELSLCDECRTKSLEWHSFPDRKGFNDWMTFPTGKRQIRTPQKDRESKLLDVNVATFLQAWIYFGMLYEFFGNESQPLFVSPDSDHKTETASATVTITTSALNEQIIRWIEAMRTSEASHKQNILQRTKTLLDRIAYFDVNADGQWTSKVPPALQLSIMVLHEALSEAWNAAFADQVHRPLQNKLRFRQGIAQLIAPMERSFWCPRDIAILKQNIAMIHFALHLGPRQPQVIHRHPDCSIDGCVKENVDEANYITRHRESGCNCDTVVGASTAWLQALESGQPFGLQIFGSSQAPKQGQQRPQTPFVAISHLWADGLGNPKHNALPTCQLRWIQHVVDGVATKFVKDDISHLKPITWWMDTMLVPVNDGALRKQAIADMNKVYENATFTLVLDHEIMQHSLSKCAVENLVRILFSRWAHRIWTLRESWTSQRLVFQFADRPVYLGELVSRLKDLAIKADENQENVSFKRLREIVEMLCFNLQPSRISNGWEEEPDKRLYMAFSGAESRATSRPKDELTCIAGMAGWTADKIKQISQHDRMTDQTRAFVSIERQVPRTLALRTTTKLSDTGYRWCPQRLLRNWTHEMPPHNPDRLHTVTPDGLVGKWEAVTFRFFPCFFITPPGVPNDRYNPKNMDELLRFAEDFNECVLLLKPNPPIIYHTIFLKTAAPVQSTMADLIRSFESKEIAMLTTLNRLDLFPLTDNESFKVAIVEVMDSRQVSGVTEPVTFAKTIFTCDAFFAVEKYVGKLAKDNFTLGVPARVLPKRTWCLD